MINYEVIKMEFRRSLKSLIIWALSVGLTLLIIVILYPMVKDMYAMVPPEYLEYMDMMGGIPTNIIEYVGIEAGMLMQIFATIFAAITGFSVISREVNEQSTDLIFTLPITRSSFYMSKLLSALVQIIIFSLIIFLSYVIGFAIVGPVPNLGDFTIYMIMNTLLFLIIGFLGFYLGSIIKKRTKSMLALIIPLPLYVISVISVLSKDSWLENLKYITPFTFAEQSRFLQEQGQFEFISLFIYLGITIFAIIHGLHIFKNKEFTC